MLTARPGNFLPATLGVCFGGQGRQVHGVLRQESTPVLMKSTQPCGGSGRRSSALSGRPCEDQQGAAGRGRVATRHRALVSFWALPISSCHYPASLSLKPKYGRRRGHWSPKHAQGHAEACRSPACLARLAEEPSSPAPATWVPQAEQRGSPA